jgi:hypothetical protein
MSPSETIVRHAGTSTHVTDEAGRRLSLRKTSALDTLRLLKAAGPALSQNEAWLAMAGLVFSVTEIDGVPVPAPVNEAQIEALVERLGDFGLAAIAGFLQLEAAGADFGAAVGNLPGTLS